MQKKLKSNTGASILIALLLFLVCAVVGSIVLASATAASCRVSGLVESDRRYYAVRSAAELFRDMMDKKELTVTRQSEQNKTYTWYDGASRGTPTDGDIIYTFRYQMADSTSTPINGLNESLLTKATLDYVLGVGQRISSEEALLHLPGESFSWTDRSFAVKNSGDAAQVVDVTVELAESGNGALLFTFQNNFSDTPNDMKDQKFTLSFTLTPTYSYVTGRQIETVPGNVSVVVELVDEGGNPLPLGSEPILNSAGIPLTRTKFAQIDKVRTDMSVIVTWTASPIIRQGGAE